jgi:hypothetical protein
MTMTHIFTIQVLVLAQHLQQIVQLAFGLNVVIILGQTLQSFMAAIQPVQHQKHYGLVREINFSLVKRPAIMI